MASKLNIVRLKDSEGVSPNGSRSLPGKIELYKERLPYGISLNKTKRKLNKMNSRIVLIIILVMEICLFDEVFMIFKRVLKRPVMIH
jgi:hypothetical protein